MNKIGENLALSSWSKLIQNAPFAIKIYKNFFGGGNAPGPPYFAHSLRESANLDPFSVIEPPSKKKLDPPLISIYIHTTLACQLLGRSR